MVKEFRTLALLCSLSALLILIGFFLTSIPVPLQIIILLAGVGFGIYTLIGLIRLFIGQSK